MNSKKTFRIVSLVVALSLILTSTAFAYPKGNKMNNEFKNFNWNKSAIYMRDKGIMKGYGNGDFGFADYVKRGDITVMIVRAFQISTILGDIESKFPDVPVDSYYYEAISTAKYYGIAKGDGKHFNPKKYVTLSEAIALIERSASVANNNAIIDEDADLEELYEDEDLSKFATRDDIAKMLYYVLTGDIYDKENEDKDDDDKDLDDVEYETLKGEVIDFDKEEFIASFESYGDNDEKNEPDYIEFKIPDSQYGNLYYEYDEDSDDNDKVKSTYDYYYDPDESSKKDISKVTFVPNSKYAGTFYIEYKAYDDDGDWYLGEIKIVVKKEAAKLQLIKYISEDEEEVNFNYTDIKEVFSDVTDEAFDYVIFELPDSEEGKLYYDYDSESKSNSLVIEDKEYDKDDIDEITFLPDDEELGYIYIDYTVYDTAHDYYTGQIRINVK